MNKTFNKDDIIKICIICITMAIITLIVSIYFNYKLNKQYHLIKQNINKEEVKEIKKFNYLPLHDIKPYDSKKAYVFFDEKGLNNNNAKKDEAGILLISVNGKDEYNPVSIAQYGLDQFGNYIYTNNKKFLEDAITQAEYLLSIQNKTTGQFHYKFDFKVGGTNQTLKAPWSSAMASGNIISLFSRIYAVTKDEKYIEACKLAMKPFYLKIEEGGFVADFFGYKFYEEYPTIPSNYTLNGFMFSLIGLLDYYNVSNDNEAKLLYDEGINTLEYELPFFDSTGISLYHLGHITDKKLPVHYSEKYHLIHIGQLEVLNQF